MYCLWCDDEVRSELSWKNFLTVTNKQRLCNACFEKLEKIQGNRCIKCSRKYPNTICRDCKRWREYDSNDPLVRNVSVYTYNERMKEMVAQWKYRGDYCLTEAFQHDFNEVFYQQFSKIYKRSVVVPIPLSKERLLYRGFNQAFVLAQLLPLKRKELFVRKHSEKQAKKSRRERVLSRNPFKLLQPINKTVILVDDIYTTGMTVRHAARLLQQNGCPEVYSYTLIRG